MRPADLSVCRWWQICCVASAYWVITERRILRRTFGPTKDRDISWKIKTNDELNKLIRSKNTINYV